MPAIDDGREALEGAWACGRYVLALSKRASFAGGLGGGALGLVLWATGTASTSGILLMGMGAFFVAAKLGRGLDRLFDDWLASRGGPPAF